MALVLLTSIAVGQEASLGRRLAAGRKVATFSGGSRFVTVAPDGSAVAAVDHKRSVAVILAGADGAVTESTHKGAVSSIALLPNGRGYWLGLSDGSLVHVPADGEERVFVLVPGKRLDGLGLSGGHVAWSSSAADRGGVVDARSGKSRFTTDAPFGGYRQPRMFLSRDARHVVHYVRDPQRGGRRLLLVRDVMSGKRLASANSYVSHRDRSHAFGLDGVFTAARKNKAWHLHRLDLVDLENHVIDDDLRGKHFVDLFMSPSAHYMLEGDFEDKGAVLYHLANGGAHRSLLGNRVTPLGFLGAADYGEELAVTTGEVSRKGITVWSTKTSEKIAELPFVRGERFSQVGSMLGGKALWLQRLEYKKNRSIVYHLEIVKFPR